MWTGFPAEEPMRMTEDRDKWRKYVHGVANARIEDGQKTEQKVRQSPSAVNFNRQSTQRHRHDNGRSRDMSANSSAGTNMG